MLATRASRMGEGGIWLDLQFLLPKQHSCSCTRNVIHENAERRGASSWTSGEIVMLWRAFRYSAQRSTALNTDPIVNHKIRQ